MESKNRDPDDRVPLIWGDNMRSVVYLIAVLNILLGLFMIYGRPDVFRGQTIKDAEDKKGEGEGPAIRD